ncbi:odorant receptor 131-2-like isoform X2 [Dicentrarchus labrax]|uniref:odorant receptor 131-2-like isoform X2 n=2 Tax=Dicentrarchus labrax TaxID=13489 RepID=UPI0021F553D0|nr:odorant receptor 131-2-like isoform X2 [Dicentrarchus labrax]
MIVNCISFAFERSSSDADMNFTPGNNNLTMTMNYRDAFVLAVGKNVTVIVLAITINYINATLVHTFNKHHIFKLNPRYILFIHLTFNDMIQLTTSISLFVFSYAFHTIYVSLCCLLILPAILTTRNTPLNLAFMAAECYIAVCIPLRYNNICTVKRTYIVIGIIWTMSSLSVLPDVFILLATEPLEFLNSRVFCSRDSVFRSPYTVKKRDVSHILFLVVVWLTLFYSYFRILFVAKAANADAKKARNTILLHGFQVLLCMTSYVRPMLSQVLTYLFPGSLASINFVMFIINQILPRFVSPIVYGLRDKTFRKYFKSYLCTVNRHPKIEGTLIN